MFFGESALPSDPVARAHERRGRRWLALSYLFCPCHIPITLGLLGAALGGTAVGTAVAGSSIRLGVVLTALYGLVLWRGFRQIRIAKHLESAGEVIVCRPNGCVLADLDKDAASAGRPPAPAS